MFRVGLVGGGGAAGGDEASRKTIRAEGDRRDEADSARRKKEAETRLRVAAKGEGFAAEGEWEAEEATSVDFE